MRRVFWLSIATLFWSTAFAAGTGCGTDGARLQVLGSGGPESTDGRASTSYLLWENGRAILLVDMGSGSMRNFERSGASIDDLEAILLTHLHVDHSVDLPALVKASYFTRRDTELPLYGPGGNDLMPGTREFVQALLGPAGPYRYLSSYLDGSEPWRLSVHEIKASGSEEGMAMEADGLKIIYVPVHHGPIPALAWKVELSGKRLVFSGDMSGRNNTLAGLAAGADLLVAHNAIPEDAGQSARSLHMPPSEIGRIASEAGVKSLLLSHRMNRTLGREKETLEMVRRNYQGPVTFAEDMMCVSP